MLQPAGANTQRDMSVRCASTCMHGFCLNLLDIRGSYRMLFGSWLRCPVMLARMMVSLAAELFCGAAVRMEGAVWTFLVELSF